ncbi:MAG: BatA domain-containing protein, partial [Candidatus Kapaibacteriota bacterium]
MTLFGLHFASPIYLWLLLIIPLIIIWYVFYNKKLYVPIKFSTLEGFQRTAPTLKVKLR